MGPSSDFRQGRLPFGLGRACEQLRPSYQEKVDRWADQRRQEEQRANCIDYWCNQFRGNGNKISLHKPDTDPRLHLVVNGTVVGVFFEQNGKTKFDRVQHS